MRTVLSCLATGVLAVSLCVTTAAQGEEDLSGEWAALYHEDFPDRLPGPELGEYQGLPLNAAARRKAQSWDAAILSVPEHQCKVHPATYSLRGPSDMRVYKDIDLATQEVTAWHLIIEWLTPHRVIYMDGRSRPSRLAQHTWGGFSTGRWEGGALVVETTHLKAGYLRRNGVPTSDQATMIEYFRRYGEYLSHVRIVNDPLYFTEPVVHSTNWILTTANTLGAQPCRPAIEVVREPGEIPHHLPWVENPMLHEFSRTFGLPAVASDGGAETMYPEFMRQLPQPR